MAIHNTLQKCLESPYLFADPAAPGRVPALLGLARDRLDAATRLLGAGKADAADVGALAHEAMFAAVRALVYARGYREAGLKCLILAAEAFYVRPGRLEAAAILDFERVQAMKLAPGDAVEAAARLVARAAEIVGS